MAYSVDVLQEPDNVSDVAGDIQTWLNALSITTFHSLNILHVKGFFMCIVVYE